jgi:hypothetical protein
MEFVSKDIGQNIEEALDLDEQGRSANLKHRKQNVGDRKQVLHMGFEAKHESQLKRMRPSVRVFARFIPL